MKLFFLLLVCAAYIPAQVFNNFSVINGLPDNHVKSIVQDENGLIWFGTLNGLARYDGYEFRKFRNDPENPSSLSNNAVWILLRGKSGCLWIGTRNGDLNRYDPKKNKFEHWNICSSEDGENYISCLYEEDKDNIWIGTYNKGLYRFNPTDKSITRWQHDDKDSNSISNDFINAIKPDSEGNLWIGTYSGLNKFSPKANDRLFIKYFSESSNTNSLSNNLIWNITYSNSNPEILYVGTYSGITILNTRTISFTRILPAKATVNQFSNSIGSVVEQGTGDETELWLGGYGGLIKYSLSSQKSEQWDHNHKSPKSLVSNQINDMILDKSGVIWIATEDGVSSLPRKILKFKNEMLMNLSKPERKILDELEIHSMTQDSSGDIFIGTSVGLKRLEFHNDKLTLADIPQLKGKNIWSLYEGSQTDLWIGTYGQGLFKYNLKSSEIVPITFNSPTDRSTPYNYVKTVCQDSMDRLWVGFWGGGLSRIDLKTGSQKIFRKDSKENTGITFNDVWRIYQDSFGRIWIGTKGGGLNLYNEKSGRFLKIKGTETTISNNVLSIYQGKSQQVSDNIVLWIGTTEGLYRLEVKENFDNEAFDGMVRNITHYGNRAGLANEVISEIVEDDKHNLWLSTSLGLSEFITTKEIFINFSSSDGLAGGDFSEGALLKNNQGFVFAGGSQGLNVFNPEDIRLSDFNRKVIFTDFLLQNKRVSSNENTFLPDEIAYSRMIKLRYNQNSVTFYFSSTDYNAPGFVEYSHILKGFETEWSIADSRNYVSYTNLDPGEYTLMVKATNSDGVWNDSISEMKLTILPPWWKTGWAYGIYILLIIGSLFAIRKFQTSRAELRNELKMREFEARKYLEVENLKSRFFANLCS